jgi:YHS domain-containing protein
VANAVALEGYCPVCVIEMKKWVRGNPSIQATYDGKTYYFPGEDQKRMFTSAPDKYVPALGGDCTVCMADMGARSPGSIRHSALSQNRLYLFPNENMKVKFASDPLRYIKADVALGGNCSVCRVEMNKDVPGSPDVFLRHSGVKYQFASDDQRKMFMANPSKYAVKPGMPAAGSMTK